MTLKLAEHVLLICAYMVDLLLHASAVAATVSMNSKLRNISGLFNLAKLAFRYRLLNLIHVVSGLNLIVRTYHVLVHGIL